MTDYWLNTYHPLAASPAGPWARHEPQLPPYVDASCRREPDLESDFPTITGLCRPPSVRQLNPGAVVIYTTIQFNYGGQPSHRRLTAVLRVKEAHTSHAKAGDFFVARQLALPRNLMLPGNDPLPLGVTEGFYWKEMEDGKKVAIHPSSEDDWPRVVAEWNATYVNRKNRCQDVRICERLFVDVTSGRVIDDEIVRRVFGTSGFPNTQLRPVKIDRKTVVALLEACDLEETASKL